MNGVNKAILVGTLGRDPETRYMPSGDAVTTFSMATSESWKDKSTGEKKETTEWHNCVAFRRLGEIAGEYLKKGSKVYVEGKLKTESFEKDGAKQYRTKIVVDQLQMLSRKGGDGDQSSSPDYDERAARVPPGKASAQNDIGFDDDLIPF